MGTWLCCATLSVKSAFDRIAIAKHALLSPCVGIITSAQVEAHLDVSHERTVAQPKYASVKNNNASIQSLIDYFTKTLLRFLSTLAQQCLRKSFLLYIASGREVINLKKPLYKNYRMKLSDRKD